MTIQNQTLADKTRGDFPLFSESSKTNCPFIYLDHAATSQKPKQVLAAIQDYYSFNNANVHRGAHQLSAKATKAFEDAREITAKFINANSTKEIIFTRNASESINLAARTWGDSELKKGDEVLLTLMEHHSNLVPWQLLAQRTGCVLRYVNITSTGELDLADFKNKLNNRTKLVSIVHVSNVLGCCNPIDEISQLAHKAGALILLDACQSLAHQIIDVSALDIDFLAGSSHKLCGPTGVGFLWGKEELLSAMPPFLAGGEMIQDVYLDKSTWADLPHKFEAGTPAIGEAIGMGAALKYLQSIGLDKIHAWEQTLTNHLFQKLQSLEGVQVLGPNPSQQPNRGALATFDVKGVHANDISALLDSNGIFIRSGHHCCQPLHRFYELNATARASLSFTTTLKEIDQFIEELNSIIRFIKEHS